MKLFSDTEIQQLIKDKKITMTEGVIELDSEYITKRQFCSYMREFCGNDKRDIDDKNDYRKNTQKSREKRRKSK